VYSTIWPTSAAAISAGCAAGVPSAASRILQTHSFGSSQSVAEPLDVNTYSSYVVRDKGTGNSYLDLITLLQATSTPTVTLHIMVTLMPPSELESGCSYPANSPLTNLSELSYFGGDQGQALCTNYRAWSQVLGKVAQIFPSLKYVNVDDFTDNLDTFDATVCAVTCAHRSTQEVSNFHQPFTTIMREVPLCSMHIRT